MRAWVVSFLVAGAIILLETGCPNPAGPVGEASAAPGTEAPGTGTAETHIKGVAYDLVSGEPVAGVSVSFGGSAVQTAADGSFDLDLGTPSGTLTGDWAVRKTAYQFTFIESMDVPTGTTHVITLPLARTDPASYASSTHVTGSVHLSDGAEAPDGAQLSIWLFGRNGTLFSCTASYAGGFQFDTPLRSSDCLLLALAVPKGGQLPYVFMRQGLALSGSGTVTADLVQEDAGFADISVTADHSGNLATCVFITPYGAVPGFLRAGSGDPRQVTARRALSSAGPEILSVFNPFGWDKMIWSQEEHEAGWPAGHMKVLFSTTEVLSSPAAVTLPAIDHGLGPAGYADSQSLDFVNGLLSLNEVQGTGTCFFLLQADTPSATTLGQVWTRGCGAVLPNWLVQALGGGRIACSFGLVDSASPVFDLLTGGSWSSEEQPLIPQARMGIVMGSSGLYQKVLDFPGSGSIDGYLQ
jgi:hypothetical protein